MTLLFCNIPLISADADSHKNTVLIEETIKDNDVVAQSVASTIAWYRRPIVKDILVGVTIVSLGAVIVAQKIKIDGGVRQAFEAHSESSKNLNDAQDAIAELKKTLAIAQQAMPALKNTEAEESKGLGGYFFIGSIIFAICGNYGW